MSRIKKSLSRNPVTAILGPRQSGKTTLAKILSQSLVNFKWFDLENPLDFDLLSNSPKDQFEKSNGLIIIDEIQRIPALFNLIRVIVDNSQSKFLVLGSASPHVSKYASDSLAGRIEFVDIHGFNILEVGISNLDKLWLRGGFPRSFLANNDDDSFAWRENFTRTFLERDLGNFGINISPIAMRRFWTMLSHMHGQLWNAATISRSMGVSEVTVKRYLDILTEVFMIRQLTPFHVNIKKRQIRSPKIYFRDTGILHSLLRLNDDQILSHPKLGSSWEGFLVEQILSLGFNANIDAYFWSTYTGAEVDLVLFRNGKRIGVEIKRNDVPKTTRSMHIAIENLSLDQLLLVYPGSQYVQLMDKIFALPATEIDLLIKD